MAEGTLEEVVAYAGVYDDVGAAKTDFAALHDLHKASYIGKFQAAIFEKTAEGKVKVIDTTSTTRATGAKWGAAIGGVIGLLFPPSILAGAAIGAGAGALAGTLAKGWMGSDIKYVAEQLQPGESGVIVVAQIAPELEVGALLAKAGQVTRQDLTPEEKEAVTEALDVEEDAD